MTILILIKEFLFAVQSICWSGWVGLVLHQICPFKNFAYDKLVLGRPEKSYSFKKGQSTFLRSLNVSDLETHWSLDKMTNALNTTAIKGAETVTLTLD